jgi:dolichol-phosphate mannosyltransferase
MRNNIAIIIPTYNAKNTIIEEINGIFKTLPDSKIFIVDDSSPDGTANLIRKFFAKDGRLELIVRKQKAGRGTAVITGIKTALRNRNTGYFIEMDADLCHDPKYIPLLVSACRISDVAIASKYLKTSRIIGLEAKRVIFSKFVNRYIKLMLGVPISDYTNGFRCYKRRALEKIDLDSFTAGGFIMLSEIVYKMYKKGCTFSEIPFTMVFNGSNKSNFNLNEIGEAFLTILKLRFS